MKYILIKILFFSIFLLSSEVSVAQEKPKAELADSSQWYGSDDGNGRISNFLDYFDKNKNNSVAYIIVYGGRISKRGEIKAQIRGLTEFFTIFRKLDSKKYVIVNGGYRDRLTVDYWIVPENSCPPLPTPTVDFEKVKFKGRAPNVYHYWCC
jgi:hypothetical protein